MRLKRCSGHFSKAKRGAIPACRPPDSAARLQRRTLDRRSVSTQIARADQEFRSGLCLEGRVQCRMSGKAASLGARLLPQSQDLPSAGYRVVVGALLGNLTDSSKGGQVVEILSGLR